MDIQKRKFDVEKNVFLNIIISGENMRKDF